MSDSLRATLFASERVRANESARPQVFEIQAVMNKEAAASWLGVSLRTLERHIKNGDLPARRIGKRVVLVKGEIEAWLLQKGARP